MVDEQIRIEVALPVVPQAPGVAFQLRHLQLAAFQRPLDLTRVETGRIIDVGENLPRNAQVLQHHAGEALDRRQVQHRAAHRRRHHGQHARVEAHGHFRRMRGPAEHVHDLADAQRFRIDQMETAAVQPLLVRDVIHRIGDEIHRHDVHAAAFHAQRRHPLRQRLANLLDQGEQVVRAIDLVDLARLRMPDHESRAIDAVRDLAVLAHQPFGIVLGAEIRVLVQPLRLVEHVFAEHAGVEAGRRDRTGVVETAGLHRRGQFDRMLRAFDVGDALRIGIGAEIVDRGEVEEVHDLAGQRLLLRRADAQFRLRQVAGDRHHALAVPAHLFGHGLELLFRTLAHQHMDRALALEQIADQVTADETGGTGNEVGHASPKGPRNHGGAPSASA